MTLADNNYGLLENLEVAVILIDRQGVVRRVNSATENLLEKSRRYLLGCQFTELISNQAVAQCVCDCLKESAKFTLRELQVELLDRELLVDMTLSSVFDEQGDGAAVLVEMSSLDRSAEIIRVKNQLERQQSLRVMMRGLAHEIKNPLSGLRGAAQLLAREISEPDHLELTKILIKETDRLTHLVDRVMGSREQLNLMQINIHEVLEHVVELLGFSAKEQMQVNREYDPALPEITVDKEQLIQAVLNIVVNALEIQQSSSGVPTIGLITEFERFVTIDQKIHRKVLKIKIWDQGPGVAKDMRNRLFDPLVTNRPEGTGLGLSITQEIIARHSGLVVLEEHEGHTCFSIYLPYLDEENQHEQ